jgi:hypothetical protein
MADYRAYLVDENDRIISAKEIKAASDERALEAATQCIDGHDVEVCWRDRKTGRLLKR